MVVDRDPEVPLLLVSRQEALKSPTSRPIHAIIVHFTRLGRQGFYDVVNRYLCFFSKHNEYCKTEAKHFAEFFQIFKQCFLDDFHKYKMSMGLYNGTKP